MHQQRWVKTTAHICGKPDILMKMNMLLFPDQIHTVRLKLPWQRFLHLLHKLRTWDSASLWLIACVFDLMFITETAGECAYTHLCDLEPVLWKTLPCNTGKGQENSCTWVKENNKPGFLSKITQEQGDSLKRNIWNPQSFSLAAHIRKASTRKNKQWIETGETKIKMHVIVSSPSVSHTHTQRAQS